jgi:hypothetical protein
LTKVSVVPLTKDRYDDWVRVYNEGRQNISGFVSLHTQELGVMLRNGQCKENDMYLALHGRRPTAAARFLEEVDSRVSFIADLTSLPDISSGVEALIEFFMERARLNGSTNLASWTFMSQLRVPDILSKFTFDTRRVRHEMFADLNQARVREFLKSPYVRELDHKNTTVASFTMSNMRGIRPLDLFEIRDEISDNWQPRFLGFENVGKGHLMVASQSNQRRTEGRIDLTDLATRLVRQDDFLSELISDIVLSLYRDGVRHVKLEIDAGIELKQSLLDSGFEVRRTLLEMCPDIMQD